MRFAQQAKEAGQPVFRQQEMPAFADGDWMTPPARQEPQDMAELGVAPRAGALPSDYLGLVDQYGPGTFGGVLRLFAPDEIDRQTLASLARLPNRGSADESGRPAVHPEPAGLRLWGSFTNGVTCWWAPAWPSPDGWAVVLMDTNGGWQRLPFTVSGFLRAGCMTSSPWQYRVCVRTT